VKKYLIAILFGISFLSIQTVSASTLIALNPNGLQTIDLVSNEVHATFNPGEPSQPLFFDLQLDAASDVSFDIGSANLSFYDSFGALSATFLTGSFSSMLSGGDNFFAIFSQGSSAPIVFNINEVQVVPVPAALWLFGSALLGLMGVSSRKSQALAA
jgi:hypothetical protein